MICLEELKSYRDFDLHYTSELPLSSFIPIPEDKEIDDNEVSYLYIFSNFLYINVYFDHKDFTINEKHSEVFSIVCI